jgi:ribosomal protein S18 acetylase RimI-like enzyme
MTAKGEVVGSMHCIRNETDFSLWYYGDLFVTPEYRRMGIARQMVETAISRLSEIGAAVLRCYVDPNNMPSRNLQKSIGFEEKPFKTFNCLCNDGQIMHEIKIPSCFCVIPATVNEAYFVMIMFAQNKSELKAENISLNEWKELLSADNPDEKHFLICKGAVPACYMCLSGASGERKAHISMLFVKKELQRCGAGTFALHFAERYAKENGFDFIATSADKGNTAAENCFLKCGYTASEHNSVTEFCKNI